MLFILFLSDQSRIFVLLLSLYDFIYIFKTKLIVQNFRIQNKLLKLTLYFKIEKKLIII